MGMAVGIGMVIAADAGMAAKVGMAADVGMVAEGLGLWLGCARVGGVVVCW